MRPSVKSFMPRCFIRGQVAPPGKGIGRRTGAESEIKRVVRVLDHATRHAVAFPVRTSGARPGGLELRTPFRGRPPCVKSTMVVVGRERRLIDPRVVLGLDELMGVQQSIRGPIRVGNLGKAQIPTPIIQDRVGGQQRPQLKVVWGRAIGYLLLGAEPGSVVRPLLRRAPAGRADKCLDGRGIGISCIGIGILLDPGQDDTIDAPAAADAGTGKIPVGVVETVVSQAELFEVVRATGTVGCFAHLLHGREQQRDQHSNDRDHDQELDQSERRSMVIRGFLHRNRSISPGGEKQGEVTGVNHACDLMRNNRYTAQFVF